MSICAPDPPPSAPCGADWSAPEGAPASRMRAVSALVSMPPMPGSPWPSSQCSRCSAARQLAGSVAGAHDEAACRRGHGLDVLGIGAGVADMGEGEGDDLPGVGRVGQDLLIAGHRGIEADLAHRHGAGAEAAAPEHRAVGKHQCRGGIGRPGAGGEVETLRRAQGCGGRRCGRRNHGSLARPGARSGRRRRGFRHGFDPFRGKVRTVHRERRRVNARYLMTCGAAVKALGIKFHHYFQEVIKFVAVAKAREIRYGPRFPPR
jgi:hypothetical protein